jgi:hypothetical protein
MTCAKCGGDQATVCDSRESVDGLSIRRRRVCRACGHRWTTYEREQPPPSVDEEDIARAIALCEGALARPRHIKARLPVRRRDALF